MSEGILLFDSTLGILIIFMRSEESENVVLMISQYDISRGIQF